VIVKTRLESEIVPNGVSILETIMATYVVIQHYPKRMVIRIPKSDPKDYTLTEETYGERT
jgi:hypothetical protein